MQVQDDKFDTFAREMRDDMATLKRGVYGDPANKVKGLLQRQDDDDEWKEGIEDRIEKSERKQWKLSVMVTGLLVGMDAAWNFFKDKV